MIVYKDIHSALLLVSDKNRAQHNLRFFKTGKGQYGERDVFLGVTMPKIRNLVNQFQDIPLNQIMYLLKSLYHEERMMALLFLVRKYKKADKLFQKELHDFYITNIQWINNWDLVDCSAEYIVGAYAKTTNTSMILTLAKSPKLWEKRISIISTFHFIKKKDASITFAVATILIKDPNDLIHKAVGWMLREVGKRIDIETEESFLKKHYVVMPRTMLRYAIERFPLDKKKFYMKGNIERNHLL